MKNIMIILGCAISIIFVFFIIASSHGISTSPTTQRTMQEPFRSIFMKSCLSKDVQVAECLCVEQALLNIHEDVTNDNEEDVTRLNAELHRLNCEDYRDKTVSSQTL